MATILMADMVLCACGIAKEDCDYHKPVPVAAGKVLRFINGNTVRWTDVEFTPIADGSIVYFRYDADSKSWKRITPETATADDHAEYILGPA